MGSFVVSLLQWLELQVTSVYRVIFPAESCQNCSSRELDTGQHLYDSRTGRPQQDYERQTGSAFTNGMDRCRFSSVRGELRIGILLRTLNRKAQERRLVPH